MTVNDAVKAELCKRDFFRFVQEFWDVIIPEDPVYNWHIPYLCSELMKVNELVEKRDPKEYDLIINIPPGSTKSTICTIFYPAWVWTRDPAQRFITSSYSQSLSTDHAVKSRDVIRSEKYQKYFPHVQMKQDKDNKTSYANTELGERLATSVGSAVTGSHAHQIIIDDPINPSEAQSDLKRERANDFITRTLSSRKVNKAMTPTILIMQRLHEGDPTGRWLKRKTPVRHICLPAVKSDLVKPKRLRIKYKGGLLDPKRMDIGTLEEARKALGSYGFAGQYEQNPAPAEGGLLKKNWFGWYTMNWLLDQSRKEGVSLRWNITIDPAYTAKQTNDPTALLAFCYFQKNLYIRKVSQVWLEMPELVKYIGDFAREVDYGKGSAIYIEPKASGLSAVQMLRKYTNLNIIIDKAPTADKVTRVNEIAPFVEAGRVFLLENSDWSEGFLHECAVFPQGEHDDRVDAFSMAVKRVDLKGGRVLSRVTI